MMTPFEIRDRVKDIKSRRSNLRLYDELGRARLAREIFNLYREVLHEVARGSLDPLSIARAAIEVEK